jgi:hypothetical protein
MNVSTLSKSAVLIAGFCFFLFGFGGLCAAPTASLEKNIQQGTDLNLDDMTKAVDKAIETAINVPLQSPNYPSLGGGVYPMKATVSHGVVTLEGKVRYQSIKDKAEEIAKNTEHVKKVINNIKVDPKLEPDAAELFGWDYGDESSSGSEEDSGRSSYKMGKGGSDLDDLLNNMR